MVFDNITEQKAIGLADVKEILKKIEKRDNELSFRANKLKEFISSIEVLTKTKAQELLKELRDLKIPRLKEQHLIKLVDILPITAEEVKTILSGYAITISTENCKKIAETIKKYV